MDSDILLTADWRRFSATLHPADVLVFDSLGFEAGLVQWADAAPVNHAALVLDGAFLVEANRIDEADPSGGAVRQVSFSDRFANPAIRTTTALRHVDVPDTGSLAAEAVLARAIEDIGRRKFAYLSIAALGPAALRRAYARVSEDSVALRYAAGTLLAIAADVLRCVVTQDRWTLSCSEFVYRCFTESTAPLPLKVEVPLLVGEDQFPPSWSALEQDEERRLAAALANHNQNGVSAGPKHTVVSDSPVADRVTPGDLWRCPSLRPVAVLHQLPGRAIGQARS